MERARNETAPHLGTGAPAGVREGQEEEGLRGKDTNNSVALGLSTDFCTRFRNRLMRRLLQIVSKNLPYGLQVLTFAD